MFIDNVMERAIYYPGFEMQNLNWLKFALLYVDHLNPIIPPRGDKYLSEACRQLNDDTDLIIPHRPDYREGTAATLDAIEVVEKILRHPQSFSPEFSCPDIVARWKEPKNWQYTLFEEKFTRSWKDFCFKHRLARETAEGLLLEKSLGLIYMSILAHAISESRGVPSLTDHPEMDKISILTRGTHPQTPQRIHVARSIIKFQIPANLAGIGMDSIIQLRNKRDFKERLHAFHTELGQWMEKVENGEAQGDFFQTRKSAFSDFSDEVVSLGFGVTTFGVGVWLFLSQPDGWEGMIKQLSAGSLLAVGSVIKLREAWTHTKSKRFTRKYLADLRNLMPEN